MPMTPAGYPIPKSVVVAAKGKLWQVRCAFGCRTRNLDVSARVLELMRFVDEHCRRTTHRRATFKSHARATIWRMTHLSGWIRTAVALLGFGRGHRAPALLAAESAIPEYGWELGLLMALSLCYWCCSYKSLFPGSHRHRNRFYEPSGRWIIACSFVITSSARRIYYLGHL
jgi:hypothetical protein